METLKWDTSKDDAALIDRIIDRVREQFPAIRPLDVHMDLSATHCNGCETVGASYPARPMRQHRASGARAEALTPDRRPRRRQTLHHHSRQRDHSMPKAKQLLIGGGSEPLTPYRRRDEGFPNWLIATKFDPTGASLADGHYSRRTLGAPQFMPPGETLVLISKDDRAVFGWWRPHPAAGIKAMNGLDGWTCTIFRNTGPVLSSSLILEAEKVLVSERPDCGPDGLLTYVWNAKVQSINPGACFQHAGWLRSTWSADGRKRLWRKEWQLCGRLDGGRSQIPDSAG